MIKLLRVCDFEYFTYKGLIGEGSLLKTDLLELTPAINFRYISKNKLTLYNLLLPIRVISYLLSNSNSITFQLLIWEVSLICI